MAASFLGAAPTPEDDRKSRIPVRLDVSRGSGRAMGADVRYALSPAGAVETP